MAISKKRKSELVTDYVRWVQSSRAVFLTEYKGVTMKQLDDLRAKCREAGGEFHIVKNTLGRLAFENAGLTVPEDLLEGSTAIGFAFEDAPSMAKALTDFARTNEFIKIKGGFLGQNQIQADDVRALADLPPLPVMRATLLGVISAPASKLVRTLAEPGRSVASVLRAFSEKENAPAAAEAAA